MLPGQAKHSERYAQTLSVPSFYGGAASLLTAQIEWNSSGHLLSAALAVLAAATGVTAPRPRRSAAHRRHETSDLPDHWLQPTPLLKVTGTSLTSLAHEPTGLTLSRSLARLHTDSETTYLTPSRGFIVG